MGPQTGGREGASSGENEDDSAETGRSFWEFGLRLIDSSIFPRDPASLAEVHPPGSNSQKNLVPFAEYRPDPTALGTTIPLLKGDFMRTLWAAAAMLVSLQAAAWAQAGSVSDETKAAREHAESVDLVLADFRKAWSEARSLGEKATALRGLAVGEVRDPRLVRTLGKFLSPSGEDPDFVIPAAAAENLAGLRSDPFAAGLLAGALGTYKK